MIFLGFYKKKNEVHGTIAIYIGLREILERDILELYCINANKLRSTKRLVARVLSLLSCLTKA